MKADWQLVPAGKILVAVSGGVDSMVLLWLLHSLAAKNRWQISVAHFNHRLRGRASNADEKRVRQTAKKLRLKCFVSSADVKEISVHTKTSVEMAARKLRHEFLARTAAAQKIRIIVLAHHADDQVELFFLRVLRGAGGEGLAGMKWQSPSPADKKVTLVRPLLGCAKSELLAFAREHKIKFREDASNASSDFLRNRIRNELLPLLRRKYQPGLDRNILRMMEIVGAETKFAADAAQSWARNMFRSRGDETQTKNRLETPHGVTYKFMELPVAIQRKVLQQQLAEAGVPVDFALIEQLRGVAGKWVSISSEVSITRNDDGRIEFRRKMPTQFDPLEIRLKLPRRAGQVTFDGKKINWKILPQKKFLRPTAKNGLEFFDADRVGDEITLRHWRAGDRFQPIGLKSAVKLQDLLVNAKIPAARRRELILAATAVGEIFWVEGLRMGEQFKLTPATKRQLFWRWRDVSK